MQNLQILTNNHLGHIFWEQRTGYLNPIKFNPLNVKTFELLISSKSNFILLDFYFSKLSMKQEIKMTKVIKKYVTSFPGSLKLFILSPRFADSKLDLKNYGNKTIVSDSFTNYFLKELIIASNFELTKKSLLKSM